MYPAVCILTAGKGSRMGCDRAWLNKALIPLQGKAAISHIIENFPRETRFVIALGHLGEQVRMYLTCAHPDTEFTFVTVDTFEGPESGPGTSLLACKRELSESFFFTACDTLWSSAQPFFTDRDWIGGGRIDCSESRSYCTLQVDRGMVTAFVEKQAVLENPCWASAGMGFVHEVNEFWRSLESDLFFAGEKQLSTGFMPALSNSSLAFVELDWTDIGTEERYRKALENLGDHDYSKPGEVLYVVNGNVIKLFQDHTRAQKRDRRARECPDAFPPTSCVGGFLTHTFQRGPTFYESGTPSSFRDCLMWLESHLWTHREVSDDIGEVVCREFYREKTLERISTYQAKGYGIEPFIVNGQELPPIDHLLRLVDWDSLCVGSFAGYHGDLHFDHVIFTGPRTFSLIDWRDDFGSTEDFGDLHYEFAKLLAGLEVRMDGIRTGNYSFDQFSGSAQFDLPSIVNASEYRQILAEFAVRRGLSWSKVETLVPLIFLNMAPLHQYPLDRCLFSKGRIMLHRWLQDLLRGEVSRHSDRNSSTQALCR